MPATPLPNLRKLFIPDRGCYIAEVDLAGAEAQVVAWDADDADLKQAFRDRVNVHIKNCRDIYPDKVKGWSDEAIKKTKHPGGLYYISKRCVHATHNGGKPKGLAAQIGISIAEAERFQKNWFGLHPAIEDRQGYILDCLRGAIEGNPPRTIYNRFGYRIVFFDRIESVFTEALTWVQQSTVGINCFRGALALRSSCPWVQILLQVHDSLVFQYPIAKHTPPHLHQIHEALHSIVVPYDDPLCIPWGLEISSESWGDTKKVEWPTSAVTNG